MSYRPKIKTDTSGSIIDFPLDAETVKGVDVVTTKANVNETGASIELEINSTTYKIKAKLKDKNNNVISTSNEIDLPLESVVVGGSYNSQTKKVVLTLQNGSTIDFSVADLVSGLQTEITSNNKLASDLVTDASSSNKFVTANEKTQITTNKNDISGIKNGTTINSFSAVETALAGKASLSGNNTFTGDITFSGEDITISSDVTIDFDKLYDTNTETLKTKLDGKQASLVSGTNIKTINNESLLGSGNITISGGTTYDDIGTDANGRIINIDFYNDTADDWISIFTEYDVTHSQLYLSIDYLNIADELKVWCITYPDDNVMIYAHMDEIEQSAKLSIGNEGYGDSGCLQFFAQNYTANNRSWINVLRLNQFGGKISMNDHGEDDEEFIIEHGDLDPLVSGTHTSRDYAYISIDTDNYIELRTISETLSNGNTTNYGSRMLMDQDEIQIWCGNGTYVDMTAGTYIRASEDIQLYSYFSSYQDYGSGIDINEDEIDLTGGGGARIVVYDSITIEGSNGESVNINDIDIYTNTEPTIATSQEYIVLKSQTAYARLESGGDDFTFEVGNDWRTQSANTPIFRITGEPTTTPPTTTELTLWDKQPTSPYTRYELFKINNTDITYKGSSILNKIKRITTTDITNLIIRMSFISTDAQAISGYDYIDSGYLIGAEISLRIKANVIDSNTHDLHGCCIAYSNEFGNSAFYIIASGTLVQHNTHNDYIYLNITRQKDIDSSPYNDYYSMTDSVYRAGNTGLYYHLVTFTFNNNLYSDTENADEIGYVHYKSVN